MIRLKTIDLHGFKTIKNLENFSFRPLNVLIGINGAGKSNLISFFRLLAWMMPPPGQLQLYVGKVGGANGLLHDGAAITPQISAHLTFDTEVGVNEYQFRLFHAAPDTLIFADERFRFSSLNFETKALWTVCESGHREAQLITLSESGNKTARTIQHMLRQCVVYQFHNTSDTARVRQKWRTEDGRFLKEDAGNLAPFLYRLQKTKPDHYARIVRTIRQVAPFFSDFVLEPEEGSIWLQWSETNTDLVFGANQASDGTLRVMALISLLLQPVDDLPAVVILDEPELGLHPYAVTLIAGLLRSAAVHRQVVIATQSAGFIDHFDPEDVVVVNRRGRESNYQRLDSEALERWIKEYSLAELWEKNVIGGRPG